MWSLLPPFPSAIFSLVGLPKRRDGGEEVLLFLTPPVYLHYTRFFLREIKKSFPCGIVALSKILRDRLSHVPASVSRTSQEHHPRRLPEKLCQNWARTPAMVRRFATRRSGSHPWFSRGEEAGRKRSNAKSPSMPGHSSAIFRILSINFFSDGP